MQKRFLMPPLVFCKTRHTLRTSLKRYRFFGGTLLLLLCCLLGLPTRVGAATYEVGPGKLYTTPSDVPWESLGPGDLVLIHWRGIPYKDKWVLCRQGEAGAPITVRGVPGPGGELPQIDGDGAVTRQQLNYWNEARGLIKIGGANVPEDTMPRHIVIENLDLTSARPPYTFTGRSGLTSYAQNAAAVYIEKGEHIVIRNCIIRNSGNGIFAGPETRNLLIEGNAIYDNGNEESAYEHNTYTEALGIIFQFNYFGPLRTGSLGNNLKDRSAGTTIRYNWIEGGNRQLDLVDAEGSTVLVSDPSYRTTFVYGNVLIEPDGAGNSQIVHYGGDSGNEASYRKGTLYFYNNTIISTRVGNTTLLRLSSSGEHADIRNNIVFVTASGSNLAIFDGQGTVELRNNWLKKDWRLCHCIPSGTVIDWGTQVVGLEPGFADSSGGNYSLSPDSPCRNAGGPIPNDAPTVDYEYVRHRGFRPRPSDGVLDIGAFEFCGTSCDPDGGTPDSGTMVDGGETNGGPVLDGGGVDIGSENGNSEDGSQSSNGGCSCHTGKEKRLNAVLFLLIPIGTVFCRKRPRFNTHW